MIDKALFLVYNIIVVMSEDITGYMQTYRSGHNGADSKSVCGQPHVGSNPTVSARAGSDVTLPAFYISCSARSLALRVNIPFIVFAGACCAL